MVFLDITAQACRRRPIVMMMVIMTYYATGMHMHMSMARVLVISVRYAFSTTVHITALYAVRTSSTLYVSLGLHRYDEYTSTCTCTCPSTCIHVHVHLVVPCVC